MILSPSVFLSVNAIVVIEWLGPDDKRTGTRLADRLRNSFKGQQRKLVELFCVRSKQELMNALARTEMLATTGLRPILHIEAHGVDTAGDGSSPIGLAGSSQPTRSEVLLWEDLTLPLQRLNVATACNLLVVIASCFGFAGIFSTTATDRMAFVALAGYGGSANQMDVFDTMREFYRSLLAGDPTHEVIDNVELQFRDSQTEFDLVTATELFADAVDGVVEKFGGRDAMRKRALDIAMKRVHPALPNVGEFPFSVALTELYEQQRPLFEALWRRFFWIDKFPSNAQRFALDWDTALARIGRSD